MAIMTNVNERNIADFLGGAKVLRGISETLGIQRAIRAGFPYAALEVLAGLLDMPMRDVTEVLGMAPRTLARRKKSRGQLSPIESDRLYRCARIVQLAANLLGDLDKTRAWLARPNLALGGNTPLSMLDTEPGARQVENVLTQISHGIYA
ncbi:MAG: antitoxin Xre/MbcA/ParS toxin-binding domain-containing protein [Planctomycetales bacterium]